jgi:multiple sugar transport system permease protein
MSRRRRNDNLAAFAFLAPNVAGFMLFIALPVTAVLVLCLFRWDLFHAPEFVGFRNFRKLLGWTIRDGRWEWNDPRFWKYLGNTVFFMLSIPVAMAGSLLLASVLNQKLPGRTFFRAVFFLPSICMGVGILLLWRFLYDGDSGLINAALRVVGIEGPDWLSSYHWAKPAIMNMGLWASIGGTNMVIYLAGLQNISPELYEAAQIDGASGPQQFRHITIPMLAPTTFFVLITSIIGGFQGEFDSAFVMTQGGPDGATTPLSYYIYRHAFEWFNMGYAATIAVVMFALIFATTLINWRLSGAGGGAARA